MTEKHCDTGRFLMRRAGPLILITAVFATAFEQAATSGATEALPQSRSGKDSGDWTQSYGAGYTLGAHNNMYPVVHPVTGKTVHLIGFQGSFLGKEHLQWKGSRLYAGAMYAIRSADQTYTVNEVNGSYRPGRTVLVSPRTFAHSPFGDNLLFIGGHDASSKRSDDKAWIFKASLAVVLGLGGDA